MKCDRCNLELATNVVLVDDDENIYLCKKCFDKADLHADYEYERQREEGLV